ncbi:MAG TPA: DEAD/DEAH box helicase, partial [Spirochaetes bacterium]|nr:DEAD/DEAH box helicase [Spirochaetota bacterium]
MGKSGSPLSHFDPLIARWFTERFGAPTDTQRRAWPSIAAGSHVLVSAPTGSGKTLAAFLWALDRLITEAWSPGATRVLYVSPLKALNNDVRKNLLAPLGELRKYFEREGRPFPDIRVHTRSGDTPGDERRRVLRRPPEILITTPESLNILLTSRSGRGLLSSLQSVILDEIHAVAGTKRGVHLITAVERLTLLSGEFQRTALSATVRPVETVAEFVGGLRREAVDRYTKRSVEIIRTKDTRRYELKVSFPPDARETMADGSWWPSLIVSFKKIIAGNRSTLLFANSRRTVERVARLINEKEEQELAYAHHGSLSRELRLTVEEKLKAGELRAIVATGSLELGIDIGELEEVVLVQTPFSLTSAVQRIGRAGHSVGATSRGTIFPTHGRDFVDAAVAARCVAEGEIEEVRPPEAPLDVLAQVLLSMTAAGTWDMDELYGFTRCAHPYRDLSRRRFDAVLEMLAGRYADTRVRELRPRLLVDRAGNTVSAREGTDRALYMSGGTIPDRGYFDLRDRDTRAKIGELDEEFFWERRVGESFAFGTRVWRVWKISHNEVEATPVESAPGIIPFWKAGEAYRDFYFSEKIGLFLEEAERSLDAPGFKERLMSEWPMDETAATELVSFLRLQREATGAPLPHRRHLLIEHFDDPANRADRKQVILHTLWGGRVNQPFALCLAAAWEKRYGHRLETFADNDCVVLMLPHGFAAADIFALARSERPERLLRDILETTGLFGARFRENAGRALLLPPGGFNRRTPLWLNRLRAGKLLEAVMGHRDFPVLLETWREIMSDDFDLPALELLLDEIDSGAIGVSECTTAYASPFAAGLVWKQVNYYMYEDDTPKGGKKSSLSEELLREVLSSPLRPRIPRGLVTRLEEKLRRTAPGYAPLPAELADWAGERLFITPAEWDRLLEAVERDHLVPAETLIAAAAPRVVQLTLPGAAGP